MNWKQIMMAIGAMLLAALTIPELALAEVDENIRGVGTEFRDVLTGWAQPILAGVVAIVAIFFLAQRKFSELAVFLGATMLVGWLVYSPDQAATTGRDIVKGLLGGS